MGDLQCPHCGGGLSLNPAGPSSPSQPLDAHAALIAYCTEQRVTEAWSKAWGDQAESKLKAFERSGHPLDRQGIAAWRESLLQQGLGTKTVNLYLTTVSGFCRWLVNRGDLPSNPVSGQTVKVRGAQAGEQRLAFTPAEVRALLDYTKAHAPSRGHWGLVWTMAYTGARNEEVAQLQVRDVRMEQGVRVFDMATMESHQRRKNAASRRLVPCSTHLSSLLSDALTGDPPQPQATSKAETRNLWGFREIKTGRWSYTASRWVNDVALAALKAGGQIRDDKRLTLYSLRHSVVTLLKHKDLPEALIAELVGHTNASMTSGRYGKKYPVGKLKTVVELIEW